MKELTEEQAKAKKALDDARIRMDGGSKGVIAVREEKARRAKVARR